MKLAGALAAIITAIAFVTYISLAIVNKQGYKIEGYGYAPAATFSFMTFKWAFMLFWDGRKYQRFLEKCPDGILTPLLKDVQINPATDIGSSYDEKKGSSISKSNEQNGAPSEIYRRSELNPDQKV